MRNLSFALTTQQMRDRSKTVTRRRGVFWFRALKPGDLVCAVEKSQGIAKGGLVRLGVIRVVGLSVEPLMAIDAYRRDTAREGFPGLSPREFVTMFCGHMGGAADQLVTRIEFEHTDLPVPEEVARG